MSADIREAKKKYRFGAFNGEKIGKTRKKRRRAANGSPALRFLY